MRTSSVCIMAVLVVAGCKGTGEAEHSPGDSSAALVPGAATTPRAGKLEGWTVDHRRAIGFKCIDALRGNGKHDIENAPVCDCAGNVLSVITESFDQFMSYPKQQVQALYGAAVEACAFVESREPSAETPNERAAGVAKIRAQGGRGPAFRGWHFEEVHVYLTRCEKRAEILVPMFSKEVRGEYCACFFGALMTLHESRGDAESADARFFSDKSPPEEAWTLSAYNVACLEHARVEKG
jgi:hypothetical protein